MSEETKKIDEFLEANQDKKVVVVQGLGFVGAVMSIVVANSDENEYAVIGVDLPSRRTVIDALNSGEFPIHSTDAKVYEYFEEAQKRNTFYATDNNYAYSKADVVIIDINLDVAKEVGEDKTLDGYTVSMEGFKKAMRTIAQNSKPDVLVLVETTVPPGTSQKIVKPIFEDAYTSRGLEHDFKIGHSYERVMPGPGYVDSIKNFYRVYSGINEKSADAVEAFLHTIISTKDYPLTRLGNTNATEMSKVLENSFRAMNIAFMQEWTEFAESADVNLFEVVNAIRMRPTHKNIMRPGLGVGGYCLTKDPLLASWSSQELFNSIELTQSEAAVRINDRMPLHTYKIVKKYFSDNLKGKKVLILGVSYLQNVGDTRYTPVELLYDKLSASGVEIDLHDPFVSCWEEKNITIPEGDKVFENNYDAIIIGTPHDEYLKGGGFEDYLKKNKNQTVFDPHGIVSDGLMNANKNHIFKIIGRGDV